MLNRLSNNAYTSINPDDPIIFTQLPDTGGLAYCQALDLVYEKDYIYTDSPTMVEYMYNFNDKKAYAGYFNLAHKFYNNIPSSFNHITLLRDPYDRFISAYYAILNNKNHPFHELFTNASIEEFCNNPNLISLFRNDLLINTISSIIVIDRPCGAVQRAKFNINNFFTLFGLSSKFEEFLEISKANLNWPDFDYTALNSVYETPNDVEVPYKIRNKINEFIVRDVEIYNYAKAVYEERLPILLPTKIYTGTEFKESIFKRIWNKIKKIFRAGDI